MGASDSFFANSLYLTLRVATARPPSSLNAEDWEEAREEGGGRHRSDDTLVLMGRRPLEWLKSKGSGQQPWRGRDIEVSRVEDVSVTIADWKFAGTSKESWFSSSWSETSGSFSLFFCEERSESNDELYLDH